MIKSRFSLLILITVTCFVWTPNKARALMNSIGNDRALGKEYMAQNQADDSPKKSSADSNKSNYNSYMQGGYQATKEKDYQKALEQFQKALQVRPQDIYAQQAIHNIESYIERAANPFNKLSQKDLALLLQSIIIVDGLLIVLWLFLRQRKSHNSQQELWESNPDLETKASKEEKYFDVTPLTGKQKIENFEINHKLPTNKNHKNQDKNNSQTITNPHLKNNETSVSLQSTTRLANFDLIEELLKELPDIEPKKRQKTIWELAQKADSRAMKPLVDLMIDTDSQERSLILEALSQISSRTLKPMNQALAISLQDKNPQVRKNAIRDLTRIYDIMSQISQLLAHAIDDSDQDVQKTAKWALSQLNLPTPKHLSLLNSESEKSVEP
ncbi:MAG TPA: hypothetical protein DCF68_05105 [Cyanothece sp. UBA12306]|nr:hypothetical protein [Cyanothece sp. UBA12306]